jgi:hypothetical protein
VSAAQHMRSARNALYALFAIVGLAMTYVTASAVHEMQAVRAAPQAVAFQSIN